MMCINVACKSKITPQVGEEATYMDMSSSYINASEEESLSEEAHLLNQLMVTYMNFGMNEQYYNLTNELEKVDSTLSWKWNKILYYWDGLDYMPLQYNQLSEGLSDDDSLCLVVLGFQLNPDGSIRYELEQRLEVALQCAKQYPNALIACTGGGTAYNAPTATEADQMAQWLIDHGVDEKRIIIENQSLSTIENAEFTYQILEKEYSQVKQLAIITSGYHIVSGMLFFQTLCILAGGDENNERINVVDHAACDFETAILTKQFQANGIMTLYNYAKNR